MHIILFLVLMATTVVTGCSSGSFVREDLLKHSGVKSPVYEEKDIARMFNRKANLPKPFKMAVYFKHSKSYNGNDWRWSQTEQDNLIHFLRENTSSERVSDIFILNSPLVADDELLSVRQAAARYRADAVLVVEGTGALKTDLNKLGGTYLLLVPALFVPGNTLESLFVVNATLWDVRNEVLYMSSAAEGELTKKYSPLWKDRDAVYLEQVKTMALQGLKNKLKEDFSRIR